MLHAEPLIPYVTLPELVLVPKAVLGDFPTQPISVKPFGVLVATGVYLGAYLAMRQVRRLGLSESSASSFMVWIVSAGFIGGHVFDVLFYYPGQVLADPLSLLRFWEGLSSYGGFLGAVIGAWLWRSRHGPMLRYADIVSANLPAGFAFGRAGCAIVHDHPGVRTSAWFAVRYPDGGRLDLGLMELLVVVPLAVTFLLMQRRPRHPGFYAATMCIVYAPGRFALDFLRATDVYGADPRYAGLTPAQWACVATLVFGVVLYWWSAEAGTRSPCQKLQS